MKHIYKNFLKVGLVAFLGINTATAQDLHYSQFYNAPLNMNPGLTGQMREDFRVGGIYRSQWKDIASPFKTMSFFADMNIKLEKKPVDMISFGANFTDDQLGDGIFKNQYFLVSSAVQKYLGYSRRHMVSFGLQLGYTNQNLNKNGLYFDDQFDDEFLPTLGTGENFGATRNGYMNLNAGLGWDFFANEKLTLNGGLGFHNLTRPKNSLLDGVGETVANKQSVRTVLNVGAVYQLSDKVSLLPSFLYARQAKASDLNLGTNIGFHLNGYKSRNRTTLYVGGFYRVGDAAIAKVGMRFRGVQAMFSYDATMSGMKDINKAPSIKDKTVGAYELSLVYSGFLNRAIPGRLTVPSRFF